MHGGYVLHLVWRDGAFAGDQKAWVKMKVNELFVAGITIGQY